MVRGYQAAMKSLWKGLCDVYIIKTDINQHNGRDEPKEVPIYEKQPCRISFSSVSSTTEHDGAPLIQQTVKLFIAKDVNIPAGSKIDVSQNGQTRSYAKSGEPAVYSEHQEIMLVPFERWA